MDENKLDLEAIVTQLNDSIAILLQKVDELDKKVTEHDTVLYDGIIAPANEAIAQQEYDQALSDFRCKYAEKLEPFVKAVEIMDNEDVYQKAFDNYNEGEYDVTPDEYVDALVESLSEQIESVKEALQVGDIDKASHIAEEVEEKAEKVAEVVDDKAHEDVSDENKEEAEITIFDLDKDPSRESDEESLEEFTKSLEKELEKEKGSLIRQ